LIVKKSANDNLQIEFILHDQNEEIYVQTHLGDFVIFLDLVKVIILKILSFIFVFWILIKFNFRVQVRLYFLCKI
jgi:hypothetical protein